MSHQQHVPARRQSSPHKETSDRRTSTRRTSAHSSPTKSRVSTDLHHRSDMLLQEQIALTNDIQTRCEQALDKLEKCEDDEMLGLLRLHVSQLKQGSQESIIMLHLVYKLHRELTYTRQELQTALRERGSDEVNLLRKRVGWMEDKMESLLDKQRDETADMELTVSPPIDRTMEIALLHPASEGGYVSDHSGMGDGDADSEYSSDTNVQYQLAKAFSKEQRKQKTDVSATDESDTKTKKRKKRTKTKKQKQLDNIKEKKQVATEQKLKHKFKPRHVISSGEGPHSEDKGKESSSQTVSSTNKETNLEADDEQLDKSHDRFIQSEVSSESQLNQSVASTQSHEPIMNQSGSRAEQAPPSRVTLRTPTELAELFEDGSEGRLLTQDARGKHAEDKDCDAGAEYWQSEHHRIEYSKHARLMVAMNPLSYHQMSTTVPGTFVQPVNTARELPWDPNGGTAVNDIHRISLDKLLHRIHQFYTRIGDGALLSVNSMHDLNNHPSFTNVMNSFDFAFTPMSRGSSQPATAHKALPLSAPTGGLSGAAGAISEMDAGVQLPRIPSRRIGTSISGRLIYYPDPLPYPERLPLCKTDRNESFPRLPTVYASSEPGATLPAERIVNQHNLYQETKFTSSLYHAKGKSRSLTEHKRKEAEMLEKKRTESPEQHAGFGLAKRVTLKLAARSARAAVQFQGGAKQRWEKMKPHSGALDHSGLKWERVKDIVHNNLLSERADERVDAARNLGQLNCGDAMVLYALRDRQYHDSEIRVKYEAAKSLVLLGCWDEDILCLLVQFLQQGNAHIQGDIMKTIIKGKNVQYVDKTQKCFPVLTAILSDLCTNRDVQDQASLDAALCLSRLCVRDQNATDKLVHVLDNSSDTHIHAKVLDALIKQLNYREWDVVEHCLKQLEDSSVWKYRCQAASLLIVLGKKCVCLDGKVEQVYDILEKRLWDDPMKEVKLEVARALAALELFPRACERAEKRLSDPFESSRVQAVASLGTLGMKSERILRALLEMLQLDSSEAVRVMVIKTFATLNTHDKRVIRALRDKEKGEGVMAREAVRSLELLGLQASQNAAIVKKNMNSMRALRALVK